PEQYISIKCLTGDTGDNIKGVDSIGPVRAATLIREYGSAFDIADAIPIASKYKYIQKLNECKDLILLNYQLMDLVTYSADAVGKENTV
ncbi:5'-3' exonuclease H3TH domain-containing protein, partial [Pseudomonas marginalis]|uniref:5'-3' exonuclease H3TH domain-containing protein n=1 Tax=Pseudomonas marginalis TaxID=298 RepID=UPI0034D6CF68